MSTEWSLIMIAGPSGVGKTTLITELLRSWPQNYRRPRSFTTRPRRTGEGIDEYSFVNHREMALKRHTGELLNIDTAYGELYGIAKASVHDAKEAGVCLIKEIHPKNQSALRRIVPEAISVMVLPDPEQGIQAADRIDRVELDQRYYQNLSLHAFDIVLRFYPDINIKELAEDAHIAINAYLRNRNRFPRPSSIDRTNERGYQRLAGHFTTEKRPTTADFHVLSYDFFRAAIVSTPEAAKVLEIGPGQGWLREHFLWPPVDYVAVDIAPSMLAFLRQDRVLSMPSTVRALPFKSCRFDRVFCSLADGYLYPTALVEIRRVLRPGGSLFLSGPSLDWAEGVRRSNNKHRTTFAITPGCRASVFSFAFTVPELELLLHQCGFREIQITPAFGRDLGDRIPSEALKLSAARLGVDLTKLAILNLVRALR